MTLAFYSGGDRGLNREVDRLVVENLGKRARLTFVPSNSFDGGEYWFHWFQKYWRAYGVRRFCSLPVDAGITRRTIRDALASEAVFLSGGNTFYFLHHLQRSGLLEPLRRYVSSGGTLMGLSAGSILMTRNITLAGLVPGESDANDVKLKNLNALALVDFEVYPHFRGSEQSVKRLRTYSRRTAAPVYAFPDGSGIVCDASGTSFVGDVCAFWRGERFVLSGAGLQRGDKG